MEMKKEIEVELDIEVEIEVEKKSLSGKLIMSEVCKINREDRGKEYIRNWDMEKEKEKEKEKE